LRNVAPVMEVVPRQELNRENVAFVMVKAK
jgi:hypothetical protein